MARLVEPPIRLCCFQRHWGPVCPDGLVMCCLCYFRFAIKDLAVDKKDGKPIDICKPCKRMSNTICRAQLTKEDNDNNSSAL